MQATGVEQSPQRGDGAGLERLVLRERRQDGGEPDGDHRLAGTGRTDEQQAVASRRRDLGGAPGGRLAEHIRKIGLGRLGPEAGRPGLRERRQRLFVAPSRRVPLRIELVVGPAGLHVWRRDPGAQLDEAWRREHQE